MSGPPPISAPPQDLEAEQATLGACLMEADAIHRARVLLEDNGEDFYSLQHQILWRTLCRMSEAGTPADPVTVQNALQNAGELDAVGGRSYLTALQDSGPTAAMVEHYAEIVRRKATLRALMQAGDKVKRLAQEATAESMPAILAAASEAVERAAGRGTYRRPAQSARALLENDRHVEWLVKDAIPRGRLVILAGESGDGKSMAAMALCDATAREGGLWLGMSVDGPAPSLYVDIEQGEDLLSERVKLLAYSEVALDHVHFVCDPEWRLGPAFALAMRPLVQQYRPALVVLDCLAELLPDDCDENSNSDMRPIMRALALFAREHDCTVLVVHHYRKTQAFGSNQPAARLRGASAIRDVADAVLTVNHTRNENERLIVHTKARCGRLLPSFLVRFDETPEGTLALTHIGTPNASAVGKAAACDALMLEALSPGRRSRSQLVAIAAEHKIGEKSCDVSLKRLAGEQKIAPEKVAKEVFYESL